MQYITISNDILYVDSNDLSLRASGVTFSRAWQVVVHGRRARELTPHLLAVLGLMIPIAGVFVQC